MSTVKQKIRERNEAWRLALAEGRVLSFNDGLTLKSYPTLAACNVAWRQAQRDGIAVEYIIDWLANS